MAAGQKQFYKDSSMNEADRVFLSWLTGQINTGKRTIAVPGFLLANTTEEGRLEARRLSKLAGCKLELEV